MQSICLTFLSMHCLQPASPAQVNHIPPPAKKQPHSEEEVIDIDLNDPDVEKAAVKIQAGFKGLRARKSMPKKV